MSEEQNAILKFIEKTRQEVESGLLSPEELQKIALKLLNLYEGEVGGGDKVVAGEESAYKDDSFEFEDNNDDEGY